MRDRIWTHNWIGRRGPLPADHLLNLNVFDVIRLLKLINIKYLLNRNKSLSYTQRLWKSTERHLSSEYSMTSSPSDERFMNIFRFVPTKVSQSFHISWQVGTYVLHIQYLGLQSNKHNFSQAISIFNCNLTDRFTYQITMQCFIVPAHLSAQAS